MSTTSNRNKPPQPGKSNRPTNAAQDSTPPKLTEMEMLIARLDDNASRYFNGLNQLDRIADRLSSVPEEKKSPDGTNGSESHIPKLWALNSYLDEQNNRLENLLVRFHAII